MRCHELRVEQAKSAGAQPRDEMGQSDLGGVGLAVEHALAKERRAQGDAIEPAHELSLAPALHRVNGSELEQRAIEPPYFAIDPGVRASGRRRGAGVDHRVEIAIYPHLENIPAHRLCE